MVDSQAITRISKAEQALAVARTPAESKAVEALAAAARAWAKEQGDFENVVEAARIYILARRKTTELIAPEIKRGRPIKGDNDVTFLQDYGFTNKQWQRRRQELEVDSAAVDEYFDDCILKHTEPTTFGLLRFVEFDYKRDNKANRAGDAYVPQGYDACQTPGYAIDPLLPYLPMGWKIWEPAAGDGLLVEAFYDAKREVIGSDLLIGQNFFDYEPPAWDCTITNPPFSIKYDWLTRCYELGKPFALLLPVETLGARTAQDMMAQHGFEIMLLDQRVDFKMPNKGWEGSAQFPVFWLCWKILPEQVVFGHIENQKRKFNHGKAG